MSRNFIVPYNMGSESAKLLANSLNIKRSRGEKRFRWWSKLVNWGSSSFVPRGHNIQVLNDPQSVALASNKLLTFKQLALYAVPTVEWTTDRAKAISWVDENTIVYARHKLNASGGEGIEIVTYDQAMPYAPLYTKGFNKTHEYRVHVFQGRVLDFTKKKRRDGTESNPLIKNSRNGWVFCRDGVALPLKVKTASIVAQKALGLDFCAIDILYKESEDKARVLEVNTAPGIEGTTLNKYSEAIKQWLG